MMKLIKNVFPATMYLIVRTDLKMGKGKIAAQCSHAAVLCKTRNNINHNKALL